MLEILTFVSFALLFVVGVLSIFGLFHRKYHIYQDDNGYVTAFRANAGYCAYAWPFIAGPMRGQWGVLYLALAATTVISVVMYLSPEHLAFMVDGENTVAKVTACISYGALPAALLCGLRRREAIQAWAENLGYVRQTNVPFWAWTSDQAVVKYQKQQGIPETDPPKTNDYKDLGM